MSRRRSARRPAADLHRAWLELVDTDGPFLAVPALKRVWPQGMPPPDARRARRAAGRQARVREGLGARGTRDRDDAAALDALPRARGTPGSRSSCGTSSAGTTPTYRLRRPADVEASARPTTRSPSPRPAHWCTATAIGALVLVVDPVDSLRDPLDDGWAASPIDRMEALLRAAGVPIGVVTDGRWWALVSARPETMVASGIVDAQTWIEEPADPQRVPRAAAAAAACIGGRPEDRLPELFGRVGRRRRGDHRGAGHPGPPRGRAAGPGVLRGGARRPPPRRARPAARRRARGLRGRRHGDDAGGVPALRRGTRPAAAGPAVRQGYGISDELDALDARAREEGSEALDATHLTWHRLLATSPGALPRRVVRGHAAAVLRRLAVRPGPLRVPHRPRRPRHAGRHGQRPGDAGGAARGPGRPAQGRARPADLVPRHRRRADRLHLRGPARLHLRRTSTRSPSA